MNTNAPSYPRIGCTAHVQPPPPDTAMCSGCEPFQPHSTHTLTEVGTSTSRQIRGSLSTSSMRTVAIASPETRRRPRPTRDPRTRTPPINPAPGAPARQGRPAGAPCGGALVIAHSVTVTSIDRQSARRLRGGRGAPDGAAGGLPAWVKCVPASFGVASTLPRGHPCAAVCGGMARRPRSRWGSYSPPLSRTQSPLGLGW